jgi:filamentous hemagglutinin family protein
MRRSTRRGTHPGNGLSLLRLRRGALLATTALQAGVALAFALPAAAQPAPSARPQGGSVVAGQASISRGGNTTTITQSTNRAAIDWRSFDVGADQRVVFQQPGASSVTLNRVTTPTPSQIAGRIEANGQVVVINGAGVVFHQGAQVEAQSFVASTADTTNAAFMAGGRLNFDRPGQPGARIENRGNITVRDTGLAALVAPGVANSGTISARMGTVVLAGAETHTIDLHGDGLVSFDVTSQVRSAPLGPDGRPTAALVTNSGTVLAEGGRVLITAQAADGVVQNLVNAGGTIRADSAGARTGSVEIAGIGGSIRVQGTVAAEGTRAGERGGTVAANTTGELTLGDTARVVASGRAGGGTVAVGTTAARARAQAGGVGAGTARRTTVVQGARVEADATERGDGGRIAMLGQDNMAFAGTATARGGPQGGNGGQVEVSSAGGLSLTGSVDTSAPLGTRGSLLIDPRDLRIVASDTDEIVTPNIGTNTSPQVGAADGGTTGASADATLSVSTISSLLSTNDVRLEATRNLSVDTNADFSTKSGALTLAAGNNVVINSRLQTKGDLALIAGDTAIPGALGTGQVQIKADVESTNGSLLLMASGSGGAIAFDAGKNAAAATRLTLVANSMTLPTATNSLQAPAFEVSSKSGAMSLGTGASTGLAITGLSGLKTSGLTEVRFGGATLGGTVTNLASGVDLAGNLTLSNVALDLRSTGTVTRSGGTLSGVSTLTGKTGGNFLLDGANHAIANVGAISAGGRIALKLAGDRAFTQAIADNLTAPGGFHFEAGGAVTVAASVTAPSDMALTGTSVTTDAGATLTSTNGTVALTGTGAGGIVLNGPVAAKTRISLQADTITHNDNTLTTDTTGTVEIARRTAGAQVLSASDFTALKVTTGTLRIGAVTRPGDVTPTATATSLDIAGSPTTPAGFTTLDLRSSGAITQSAALDTTGFTLTAQGGSIKLDRNDNVIPTLGVISGVKGGANSGDISIRSTGAMEAVGAIGAGGTATLRSGGTLTVNASGSVAGTAVALTSDTGNLAINGAVQGAGGAGGTATLQSKGTLTVAAGGSVVGNAVALTSDTGDIALNGTVTATTTLTLSAAIDVVGPGIVTAGTLAGTMNELQLSGANQITKIGNVSAQSRLEVNNASALEVSGTLKAALGTNADLVLTASSLSVTGSAETGTAGATAGSITLSGTNGVALSGTVRARGVVGTPGNVDISSGAGSVSQTAGLIAAADQVTLTGATGINQSGGVVDTPRLTAGASGSSAAISLAGSNRIDALAGLTAGRDIAVNNAIALTIDGPVRAGQQAGAEATAAITSAGAMTVQGIVGGGRSGPDVAGNVTLTATDGFLRGGGASKGAIDVLAGASFAATRVGSAGGVVTLKATSADAAAGIVTIATPVAAPSGGTLSLTGTTVVIGGPGGLGTLSAPAGKVAIAANAITLDGTAPTLIDATGGTATLAPRDAGRTISLGGGSGQLVLKNDGLARITADVLEIGRLDGGAITIAGATDISTAGTLRLLTGAGIDASTGAVLKVGRLEGEAGGAIAFDTPGGPHQVSTLGDLKAGTTLAFRAAGSLDVAGDVAGSSVALTSGGTLGVLGAGSVKAGTDGVVTLVTDLISLAGAVQAPGSAGRIEILPLTTGRAITLAGTGGLSLLQADLDQLDANTLLLGARDGSAAVAGNLTIAGTADLTGSVNRLRLRVSGDVADGGVGTGLRVGTLGDASGSGFVQANSVSLGSTGNRIGTLERLRVTDTLLLASDTALTVAGPVEAGAGVTLRGLASGANALQVTGSVASGTLAGAASGSGGTLALNTTQGGLTVAGAGVLRARDGAVDVQGATSGSGGVASIANGASVIADTTTSLSGAAGLSVAGSVQAGTGVELTAGPPPAGNALSLAATGSVTTTTGDARLNVTGTGALLGTVTATAGNLVLNGGTITGTGAIDANAVTGSAVALTLDGTGNRIGALQSLTTTGGGIEVNSLDAVSILGTVQSAGAVTLDAPTITIGALAQLLATGQTVTLDTASGISAPGRVVAGTLQGTGGTGGASFFNTANDITTLGNLDAGLSVAVNSASALTVSGTVDGTGGVTITSTAAAPTAATPRLTVTGSVLSDGDVTLATDNGRLALSGTVTAGGDVRLASTFGEVQQTAGSVTGASVAAEARTAVLQTGGTLTSNAGGDITVDAIAFNLGGTLNAGRDLVLSNLNLPGAAGTLNGTVDAGRDITGGVAGGPLVLGGSITAARSVTLSGGTTLNQTGTLTAKTGNLQLTAEAGNLSLGGTAKAGGAATLRTGTVAPTPGTPVASRDIAVTGSVEAGTTLTLTSLGAVNAASGVLKAATLTGTTGGNATMTGANQIGTLGAFAAGNTFSLDNAQALTASGPVTALDTIALDVTGALTLAAPSAGSFTLDAPTLRLSATSISQTGGAVRATTLLDAEATNAIKLDRATNVLPVLAADAGGDLIVVTAGGLSLANPVGGANVTLTAKGGDIVQGAGTLSWTGTATLTASGAIRQDGGTLDGTPNGLLTGSAGTAISLAQPGNVIPRLGPLTAGSGISVATGGDLGVVGVLSAGTGALVLDAGGAMTLGAFALSGGSVTLEAGGALTQQAGGSLTTAGTLLLTAGTTTLNGAISAGSADLNTAGLTQGAGGNLTITGLLDIAATGDTALNGSVGAGSATISTVGLNQAGGGSLTVANGLTVNASGDTALDGSVSAATAGITTVGLSQAAGGSLTVTNGLTISASGDTALDGSVSAATAGITTVGLSQASGGSLTVTNGLTINASGDTALDGSVSAATAGITTVGLSQASGGSLTVTNGLTVSASGDTALDGSVSAATAGITTVGLSQAASGSLTVTNGLTVGASGDTALHGSVSAATATITAAGAIEQNAGGSLTATGLLDLKAGTDIRLDGIVSGTPLRLTAGGDIGQAATGALTATTLTLSAGGDVALLGKLTASLVTGAAGGSLVLDGPSTLVDRIENLSAGTFLVVEADGPLVATGTLSAPTMIVRSTGQLQLSSLKVLTGGVPYAQPPRGGLSLARLPEPTTATPGATFETRAATLKLDTLTIEPLSGTNATAALRLPGTGGTMTLGVVQGLTTDLTLDLGTGGVAAGEIRLRNLTVLGGGGGTNLTGTIGGLTGEAAASQAGLGPRLQPEYQINNCPLASVNCVQIVVQLPVPTDPLRDLGLISTRDDRDDPDIFVPNVAERDF